MRYVIDGEHVLHFRLHSDSSSSHQQIAQFIRRHGAGPILDVGAAQGFLGQLLQDTGMPLDGVEPNRVWADAAAPYYRQMWPTLIEDAPLPAHTYRAVVCADVLEHTADPAAVLRHLRQ